MNKAEFILRCKDAKQKAPEYSVRLNYEGVYPFLDFETKEAILVVVKCYEMEHGNKRHNVVISFDGKNYNVWCGDRFLEGLVKKDKAMHRVKDCLDSSNLDDDVKMNIMTELMDANGTLDKSTGCHFWRTKNKDCKHTQQILHDLNHDDVINDLSDMYESVLNVSKIDNITFKPVQLLKHYAFKKHVQLQGSKGCGKTYSAQNFIDKCCRDDKSTSNYFIAGHSQMESIDLLGRECIKDNSVFWIDGVLAEAFRNAQNGNKSILLIDEILRIPARELSILISSLTPNNKGQYVLNTGRFLDIADGVAKTEVLTAPTSNLWVVTTTNIGSGYGVEQMDLALLDRFVIVNYPDDKDLILKVLGNKANEKGYSDDLVKNLIKFHEGLLALHVEGQITNKSNLRHLVEIIDFTLSEFEVVDEINRRMLNWVGNDLQGLPVQDEILAIDMLCSQVF